MSSHAWLDSLSEDWPSQPASPEESKPPTRNGTTKSSVKTSGTKIPRPSSSGSPKWNSSIVLGERSPSDINSHLQQHRRTASKLSSEAKHSHRGRPTSQSFSESPAGSIAGSVVHNTIHRQSLSSSPGKNKGHTPEWKRRLIYGDVAYGEQRDLFTSAGTGLAGMFRPPTPAKPPAQPADGSSIDRNETTMPSSPPVFAQGYPNYEVYSDESSEEHLPEHSQPIQSKGCSIRYRLADEGDESDISRISDMSVSQMGSKETVAGTKSSRGPGQFLAPPLENAESRITSNQSAARHEYFSPILIAKESDEDGKVNFAPMDISPVELQQRLEKLQRDQDMSNGSADSRSRLESDSYSTEATEQMKQLGSFVNLRRGGPSTEGSLRPLGNTSEMLPEESLQASTPKQFPSVRMHGAEPPRTPSMPAAPYPSPDKRTPHAQGNIGSPLKLFGPYDTFTNQTLLRRISQFEDANTSAGSSPPPRSKPPAPASKHTAAAKPKAPSKLRKTTRQDSDENPTPFRSVSQFGAGELDDYKFDEDFSRFSNESEDDSPPHPVPFKIPRKSSPSGNGSLSVEKRRPKSAMMSEMLVRSLSGTVASRAASAAMMFLTPKQQETHEYKRPRASPSKDPTPKRRRTLHESDISFGADDDPLLDSIQVSHQQMQLVIGRKRKDGSTEKTQPTTNEKDILSRHILRPHTPTPSQKSSVHMEEHSDANTHASEEEGTNRPAVLPRKAQHQPNLPANGGRKPSIKTEDFINEAHRIMAAIRGKSGIQSGLASVEESDAEHNKQARDPGLADSSFQESTREPFSRPPSREGKPIPRVVNRQENPELVNHLKKYEEHSDMGDIIASSLRSLGISKEDIRAVQALEQNSHSSMSEEIGESAWRDDEIVSDPPNIRISGNPYRYEHTTAAEQAQQWRERIPSNSSSSESGFSTGRSINTGSSRGSDTRRTIAPQSVSHLIPDQVGNMILDRQRNVWVKTDKAHATRTKRSNTLHSENSEDDPFADIPDLTVDVTKELQNLRNKMAQQDAAGMQSPSPQPRGRAHLYKGNSLKSILIKDMPARDNRNGSIRSPSKLMKKFAEADDEDVEHEITMYEDRLEESSPRRRMTISFSSPIASIIQDVVAGSSSEGKDASLAEQSVADGPLPSGNHGRRKASIQSMKGHVGPRPRSSSSALPRHMSAKGKSFVPRPVSIIEEKDEESFLGQDEASKELSIVGDQSIMEHKSPQRQASVSFVVTTPGRPKSQPRPENAEVLGQYVGNMSLSPLSDFTAHPDRSYAFEVSYVVGDQNLVTGDGTKKRISQAVRHLVDKLAEVQPSEPYWEDMKDLELRNKQLDSLHMLDRFCGSLVKVDVSHNSIRALDGVPTTVRELTISNNLLSELTAWDRLANLQYVDISNNNVKSLSAFSSLVHLRGLVADNCGLVNLDGVKYHDSLLTLRARGNSIEEIDFEGTSLQRLMSLDLESNKIQKLDNLHELSSLSYLNLKGNQLVKLGSEEPLPLKHLIISDNKLRKLDVSTMSRLHLLYADRNKLTTVEGLSRVPHLDNLSLREQGGSKPLEMSFLESAYEVRKLFLSGNRIEFFAPPRDYLNLQLLDLANCGLRRLPDDLGEMMPNLRVLNLNFNGLSDISGIIGIPRLKRLLLAGNRLADAKSLLKVLGQFPWLVEVDLRDNSITQGFYPPLHMIRREEVAESGDVFRLPDAGPERDTRFCGRLDMDTRISRRVYERKFVRACQQLQKLDGLSINRKIRHLKDTVWKTMVLRGMLLKPDGQPFDLSQYEIEDEEGGTTYMSDEEGHGRSKAKGVDESTRWGAEDSFAG
ncbi:Septation initiation network scaffold protein cdc11 [Cytospora mali]|uniref:Septation initiation network scaffold protein cdc11 n=1 Tax=Cytospora mali TaxID=578113 RepID=A0A194UUJ2_CYTMA|nr:Septation initiation network scaffold protein cdc11 [Valsa mali var. pyri (nom. inval.)]